MRLISSELVGILPAVPTPFDVDEHIDESSFRREVRFLLDAGVHGLVIAGSTGEGAALTPEECARLIELAAREACGGVPVIGGVIANSTREALRRGSLAAEAGADALLIPPTHYALPSDQGSYEYYQAIARSLDRPIVLYNILNSAPLSVPLIARLAEIEGIIGVKHGLGHGGMSSLLAINELLLTLGDRMAVIEAQHGMSFPCLLLGCHGSCTAISSVLPTLCVQLYDAVRRGRIDQARELHFRLFPLARLIAAEPASHWLSRVKDAINLQGRNAGRTRSPVRPLEAEERAEVEAALRHAEAVPLPA